MKNSKKRKLTKAQKQREYVKGLEHLVKNMESQLKFYKQVVTDTYKAVSSGRIKILSYKMGVVGELADLTREVIQGYEDEVNKNERMLHSSLATERELRDAKREWVSYARLMGGEQAPGFTSTYSGSSFTGLK